MRILPATMGHPRFPIEGRRAVGDGGLNTVRGDGWPPRPSGGGTPTMASTPPLRATDGRTCAALGLYPRQESPRPE